MILVNIGMVDIGYFMESKLFIIEVIKFFCV